MANTVVPAQDVYNYLGIDYADQMVTANRAYGTMTFTAATADGYPSVSRD